MGFLIRYSIAIVWRVLAIIIINASTNLRQVAAGLLVLGEPLGRLLEAFSLDTSCRHD